MLTLPLRDTLLKSPPQQIGELESSSYVSEYVPTVFELGIALFQSHNVLSTSNIVKRFKEKVSPLKDPQVQPLLQL
jgi:hypothetical protein